MIRSKKKIGNIITKSKSYPYRNKCLVKRCLILERGNIVDENKLRGLIEIDYDMQRVYHSLLKNNPPPPPFDLIGGLHFF